MNIVTPLNSIQIQLIHANCLLITPDWWIMRDIQGPFWRFYMQWEAGVTVSIDGRATALEAERFYIIPGGARFSARTDWPMQQLFIHFDVIGLYGLKMRELFADLICLPAAFPLKEIAREISRRLQAGDPIDALMQTQIHAMLYTGLAQYLASLPQDRRDELGRHTLALAPLTPALNYIDAHLTEPLSNSALAELCFMSEGHFIRRFRAGVGQTPVQYILDRRAQQAARLLRMTDWSIERIAEETGFGSRYYFHRVFSRLIGVAPSAYRRSSER
ncbi:hypothetical protein CCAX7_10620 [Capsulimonas corticalis]|uniref:Uncharacterized protein n=1 Tax=Capsulimonas corticalis TaxID=2219043 RepID=A0A402CUM0_9BACT|nr:AraC family transcriptional regulator [Capsulimonas corticalis]BDI29011.1 hypothetical protein CCAX7_10620 [Capsulimonas corticalis]